MNALKDAVTAIQQVVDNITENTGFFLDHDVIVRRLVELEQALDAEISRLAEMGSANTAGGFNMEGTGEHFAPTGATSINQRLVTSTAATSINKLLTVPTAATSSNERWQDDPMADAIEIEEISLTGVGPLQPPEPEIVELSPVEPSVLEAGMVPELLDAMPPSAGLVMGAALAGEEISLGAPEIAVEEINFSGAEEIDLGADVPVEEITLDSADLTGEEIALDSATLAGEEISLDAFASEPSPIGATEAVGEEIVLGAVELTPEEITLGEAAPGEPANEVVELESDASALDTLQWAYDNFPVDSAAAANNDASATGEVLVNEAELSAADDLTQEAAALEELANPPEEPGIVVEENLPEMPGIELDEEITLEGSNRALLRMDAPLPEEASDLIVETAPWAAHYEPQVLPAEPTIARDEAETIRSPLLRPTAPETLQSEAIAEPGALPPEPAVTAELEAPAASAPVAPPTAIIEDEEDYADHDFDPDVAAIFTEEATELLETADQSLSSWIRDRANTALVFELKRVVHTLKGGARMAGIRAMGDLSHELETLMGLVETGQVPAEQNVFDALQASLDELHRMRDVVANGERASRRAS